MHEFSIFISKPCNVTIKKTQHLQLLIPITVNTRFYNPRTSSSKQISTTLRLKPSRATLDGYYFILRLIFLPLQFLAFSSSRRLIYFIFNIRVSVDWDYFIFLLDFFFVVFSFGVVVFLLLTRVTSSRLLTPPLRVKESSRKICLLACIFLVPL